jgi:hypothetical protein
MTKAGMWEITKDPRSVFSAFLYMNGKQGYEGVPGTAADAWGQGIIDAWTKFGEQPWQAPQDAFFPAEANPSPTGQAIDDQLNVLVTDPNANNIAELLKKGQDDYVAQLGGFASSVSGEDFRAAAQSYYASLDEFFKTNYAEFYENRFKPYYEGKVLPAIS